MKDFITWILGVILVCAFIYGMWWLAKNGSYWLWYEDMVTCTHMHFGSEENCYYCIYC